MAVFKTMIFDSSNRGASVMEVLLSMAIIAVAAPFVYSQIAQTNHDIQDMAVARNIIAMRGPVLNFVRVNQDKWPDVAQIRLADEELADISDIARSGFIDKYAVRGATVTDVYLSFDVGDSDVRRARIARHIGGDAAVVGPDGVAYGNAWAASAPDFKPGDIVYRISRDIAGEDRNKYLHRGTSGEDDLNTMQRDLNMGGYNVLDVGGITASSAGIAGASALFVNADELVANSAYFSDGANMDGGDVSIGDIRVSGDISGFRNISADKLNGSGYSTTGRVIADRATVSKSVNVGRDFVLKSNSARTVSGFTGIRANSVMAPFISATEMVFYEKFGLTVSGELLMSTTPPMKIGSWTFPSTSMPKFSRLTLSRAALPAMPSGGEFGVLLSSGWQEYKQKGVVQ